MVVVVRVGLVVEAWVSLGIVEAADGIAACCLFWGLKVYVVDFGALVNGSVGRGLWCFVNVSMGGWGLRLGEVIFARRTKKLESRRR